MSDQENFAFHPKNVMLWLMLFGLSAMFLALTIGYTYTRVTMGIPPIHVPWIFVLNTLVLLVSSYLMIMSKKAYLADDTHAYLQYLKQALIVSFAFLVLQCVGWAYLLKHDNISLQSTTASGYLYLISILHMLHVIAGMPFLYMFYKNAKKLMVDPVTVMVYFSDPARQLKLRLLTIYWHFVDLLWVYLVLFFAVNYILK